ncbi:hypothetical protein LTR66_017670 [Elasticomyces elasticus]|nr:hypothetical protein LTR66_017670 [Elasticomyces elasticus]
MAAVHCRVLDICSRKFGKDFANLPASQLGKGSRFFKKCEAAIRSFDGKRPTGKTRILLELSPTQGHVDYDHDSGEIVLHNSELKTALDGNLQFHKDLLQDQWSRVEGGVSTTIITGGGSMVPYIFEELKQFCNIYNKVPIRAQNPLSTVARGAVAACMEEDYLGQRLCRSSYGIKGVEGWSRVNALLYQQSEWCTGVLPDIELTVFQGDVLDTTKPKVIKKLAGGINISNEDALNLASKFELPIYTFEGHGAIPKSVNSQGVKKVSTIKIKACNFSEYLRRKIREGDGADLAAVVNLSCDSSGRLFFDCKHNLCVLGEGRLRFDSTARAPGT